MENKSNYHIAVLLAGIMLYLLNGSIMSIGYFIYGDDCQILSKSTPHEYFDIVDS